MISTEDVRQLFQSILATPGGYTDPKMAGKTTQIFRGMRFWKGDHPASCKRHKMVFNKFGVIPEYCFDCYKVEILPRTIVELFKLLMAFEKLSLQNDNTRKCMVEGRDNCSGAYKGFVYCRGIDEGQEVQKILRNAISDDISTQVPVGLKRGCSEYAHVHPEYPQIESGVAKMEYKEDWRAQEALFDENFRFQLNIPNTGTYPTGTYPPHEIYSMQYWLRYAATIGDMSYLTISGARLAPIPYLKRPKFGAAKK